MQALIDAINAHAAPRLALDVPSGVDAARGTVPGNAVRATRTLEFIAPKAGLHTGAALDHIGDLELAGLDLPRAMYEGVDAQAELLSPEQLRAWLSPRQRNVHKGAFAACSASAVSTVVAARSCCAAKRPCAAAQDWSKP